METFDLNQYKHLPKFGYILFKSHFPNKSVNHSENPYAVPEDYKDDNNFLQHYRSLRLSRRTNIDYIGAFPHFYYVVDLYEAHTYNRPHPDLTYFIKRGEEYQIFLQQFKPPQMQSLTAARNYRYIDVEIRSIHPCLVQCLP